MANADPAATARLAALSGACARIRAAARPDDVLDAVAEEARALAGAKHAWAGRVVDAGPTPTPTPTLAATRIAGGDATQDSVPPPPPAFAALLASPAWATNAAARPLARANGIVTVALEGSAGLEGLVSVPHSDTAAAAELDAALAQLALVAGLALEASRLRARVEVVTKARELLLASVSHDLRNPLNTFAMSAGLLRDDLERNDVNAQRGISLVSRMERATGRMQSLIEDLVEASRIDAGKIDFAIREESAAQIVKDAVAAAAVPAGEKGAAVSVESVDDDARVTCDRARLLQAIAKVIAFETKSTGDGGAIKLGVQKHGGGAVFTARAIGPGGVAVPPPEEGRGGLALLIARGLVEAQHGTFRIEGTEGLVVAFSLPGAIAPTAAIAPIAART